MKKIVIAIAMLILLGCSPPKYLVVTEISTTKDHLVNYTCSYRCHNYELSDTIGRYGLYDTIYPAMGVKRYR